MRPTMTDKTEIEQIIANLSDEDHAKIDKIVERLSAIGINIAAAGNRHVKAHDSACPPVYLDGGKALSPCCP